MIRDKNLWAALRVAICLFFLAGLSSAATRKPLDKDWRFFLGDPADASRAKFDDASWRVLNVPHDWSIEGKFSADNPTGKSGGFLPAGIGWYRKHFVLPASDAGKHVFVDFDGVMANSDVWINGTHLGHRPYRYVSFEYELTPAIHFGADNVLAVRCDNSLQPSSRWYTGAGIYRHVHLVVADPVHVEHWGTFVTTPKVSAANATIKIVNRIDNQSSAEHKVLVRAILIDPKGEQVASDESKNQVISPGSASDFTQEISLARPQLWNTDGPNLYQARVEVVENGKTVDEQTTTFGIREFHFDPATGFWLNGKNFKLFGCCLHHEAGGLGAAVPIDVWQRRLQSLRDIGCNAIRTSHNPPDPAFLDLCDRMGFLVMDEMFDVWTVGKTPLRSRQVLNDYHLYFRDWWQKDVTNTVLRDRNHPCVVIYSAGNEIHDITAHSNLGFKIFIPLRDLYHKLDPTRPVTLALLRPNQSDVYRNGFANLLDVVGQNYRENELVAAHKAHPNWKIIGTENHLDPAAWRWLRDTPAYSGQFIWTGYDYLGESIGWPVIGAGSGLFDRTGFAKPQAYQAQSWWTKKPMVRIARSEPMPHIDFPPNEPGMDAGPRYHSRLVSDWTVAGTAGQTQHVEVFTNCRSVELLLNNKSLGTKPRSPEDEPLRWDVPFAPGVLKAVARNGDKIVATHLLQTAGAPARIKLVADRSQINADGSDVCYVRANVVDQNGVVVPDDSREVKFELNGPGEIAAVDSGNNASDESFRGNERRTYDGSCIAIIRGHGTGSINIRAESSGLSPGRAQVASGS